MKFLEALEQVLTKIRIISPVEEESEDDYEYFMLRVLTIERRCRECKHVENCNLKPIFMDSGANPLKVCPYRETWD